MKDSDTCPEQGGVWDTDELLALLTEQRDLYAQLAGLAEHQRLLIAGDEPERLLEVLGQRQKLVDRLGLLADRLRSWQAHWRELRPRLSEADGRRLDELVSETNGLLSAILEKDEADVRLLAEQKASKAEAMTGLKRSRQAGVAYEAAAGRGQSQLDWTDE